MHPNPRFREPDRAFHRALVEQIGFAMIFLQTPDGPRVAHSPVVWHGQDRVRFHLARGNAVSRYLPGSTALIVVNGADAYISARWYSEPDQVPTWNYLAVELEGTVQTLSDDDLTGFLQTLTAREEERITHGIPWTLDKLSEAQKNRLLKAIVGFELHVATFRETRKLAQNKLPEMVEQLCDGLELEGKTEMAALMRSAAK